MSLDKIKQLSVTVVIPTYNRAELVSAAIESALNQSRPPKEIIVVDDGSTDDTERVLSQFGPPVISIRRANGGESAARNTGLQAATGDAVIFLDSDDKLVPHSIERFVTVLEENPEVGVVYSDAYLCDRDGNPLDLFSRVMPGSRPSGMVLSELTRRNFLLVTSMVRRECLGDIRFEEGMKCCPDYDLWRRLAVRCQFKYVDEPLMCYRYHEGMTVVTQFEALRKAEIEVQRRIMGMPEFKQLTRRQQARAYAIHGIKHGVVGESSTARRFFARAIAASPTYPGGHALLGLSLLGKRTLQYVLLKRRQLAGGRLGSNTGPAALLQEQDKSRRRLSSQTTRQRPGTPDDDAFSPTEAEPRHASTVGAGIE